MRDWKYLNSSNIMKELIEYFNKNSDSSEFIDSMVGTILSNGVIFNGNETVNGMIIRPLKPVELTGIVGSATVLDNFELYFRDTNKVVFLDQFPIDLLSYANGKPQFLYIREDLSYRVSDYMFGEADEVLIARFVINTDNTWNQFYIMAQRAGTPMYNAADEFYTVDGMYVKSPGGLELSQTSGTVKRSGIEFSDKVSPDIYKFYNLASERVPLRYINTYNEIDYTLDRTYNIITNKYMVYNMNKKLKIEAENYIRNIRNMFYMIEEDSNSAADELHTMIVNSAEQSDLAQIVNAYHDKIEDIYREVDKLYDLLGDETLNSVRRAGLLNNKTLIENYMNSNLMTETITEENVTAIRTIPAYIVNVNPAVCALPLEAELQTVQDGLDEINFSAGTIKDVPAGKFTIQRVLWDVYEQTLIMQYGDKVYDSFNDAINGTGVLEYPAPFGKTIYIPLAIIVLKSGITSLNDDIESIIIDRRWVEVDQELTGYSDYVARAQSEKALDTVEKMVNGEIAAAKADSLKCTIDGATVYKDGDYYLNYTNLRNKIVTIDNLGSSSYNSLQALSAHQGYELDQKKLDKSGGTMTGTLNSRSIVPTADATYNLGSNSNRWGTIYANALNVSGTLSRTAGGVYVYSSNSSIVNVVAGSDASSNSFPNKTVSFTW